MTSRPRLATDVNYRNGVGALLLFAVLAWTFLTANFARPFGFDEGSITASIGYAMFDMVDQAAHASESFLVAFEIIDVVLVAALVAAVMLARREEGDSVVTAIADGGLPGVGDDSTEGDGRADATAGEARRGSGESRDASDAVRNARDSAGKARDRTADGGDD